MSSRFARYFERWLLGAAMTVIAFVAERVLVRFLRPKAGPVTPPGISATFADDS
jgi:hypothetical protein